MQADVPDALDIPIEQAAVGAELLTQADGHRVLQVRAAHLDEGVEFPFLRRERVPQLPQGGQHLPADVERRDVHRGREGVVGRLRHVDVGVRGDDRVVPFRLAQDLQGAIRDHLVRVHVDGGAGAALDRVHDELVVKLARNHVVRGRGDGVRDPRREVPGVAVGQGRRLLHDRHGADERRVQAVAGDGKVLGAAQGLDTVVGVRRHFARAALHSPRRRNRGAQRSTRG